MPTIARAQPRSDQVIDPLGWPGAGTFSLDGAGTFSIDNAVVACGWLVRTSQQST
jgi:hypothetical protein